jgi:hypothetical protein
MAWKEYKMTNSEKIILDLCGGTGAWSEPYRDARYNVKVVTLPDYDIEDINLNCGSLSDLLVLYNQTKRETENIKYCDIYGILAAPPCTKFSKANWRVKKEDRDFKEAMIIVRACMDIIWAVQEHGAPLKFWALENPMGYLYNFLGRPVFYFQPWQFGDTSFLATKRTALWGYFNAPAKTVKKRTIPFISSHNNSNGQRPCNTEWNLIGKKERAAQRALTPATFAKAFFKANR